MILNRNLDFDQEQYPELAQQINDFLDKFEQRIKSEGLDIGKPARLEYSHINDGNKAHEHVLIYSMKFEEPTDWHEISKIFEDMKISNFS